MTSDYDYYLRRRNGAKLGYLAFCAGVFLTWQLIGYAVFGLTGIWAIVMAGAFVIGTIIYLVIASSLYSASQNPPDEEETEDE